jgi:hypothetical protein
MVKFGKQQVNKRKPEGATGIPKQPNGNTRKPIENIRKPKGN